MAQHTVTQCKLIDDATGRVDTAFIDSRFAVGQVLQIKGQPGNWRVAEHFAGSTMLEAEAIERARDWAHQREASDV